LKAKILTGMGNNLRTNSTVDIVSDKVPLEGSNLDLAVLVLRGLASNHKVHLTVMAVVIITKADLVHREETNKVVALEAALDLKKDSTIMEDQVDQEDSVAKADVEGQVGGRFQGLKTT